eukprot:TRINITY_DN21067_c0_g1_i1.p1 TRINITY_DN21067_c0_g1~~TRINITY_DN21067_c0_g1_i1.p1  ORF type:complete len:276 (+),score=53.93 TRINITY_DN21067_c0_g1_i1:91-828(+)
MSPTLRYSLDILQRLAATPAARREPAQRPPAEIHIRGGERARQAGPKRASPQKQAASPPPPRVRSPPPTTVPPTPFDRLLMMVERGDVVTHADPQRPPTPPAPPGLSRNFAAEKVAAAAAEAVASAARSGGGGLRAEALPFCPPGLRAEAVPFQPLGPAPMMPPAGVLGGALLMGPLAGPPLSALPQMRSPSPQRGSPPWTPGYPSPEKPAGAHSPLRRPPPTTVTDPLRVPEVSLGGAALDERS